MDRFPVEAELAPFAELQRGAERGFVLFELFESVRLFSGEECFHFGIAEFPAVEDFRDPVAALRVPAGVGIGVLAEVSAAERAGKVPPGEIEYDFSRFVEFERGFEFRALLAFEAFERGRAPFFQERLDFGGFQLPPCDCFEQREFAGVVSAE